MPCLAGRWPWSVYIGSSSGRQRSPLLATLRRMWEEDIPGSAYKQGIEPAFKQPVIILRESFRALLTCTVYVWNGPTKNIKFSCRKAKRQCGCSYGSCGSLRASSKTYHRVSRYVCSSPLLSGQQTASFPHWLVRTMVVFHVEASPRVVLFEECDIKSDNLVGVTPMEHAFGIESSTGCWMLVWLLVVKTNASAPEVEKLDEDGAAAHEDLHQQFNTLNIRQKLYNLFTRNQKKQTASCQSLIVQTWRSCSCNSIRDSGSPISMWQYI